MNAEMTATQSLALCFGTWLRGKLRYSNKVIAVTGFQDASRKWAAIRDSRNLGAGESPLCVVVNTATGEHVAKISYNGRVWANDGSEIVCAS